MNTYINSNIRTEALALREQIISDPSNKMTAQKKSFTPRRIRPGTAPKIIERLQKNARNEYLKGIDNQFTKRVSAAVYAYYLGKGYSLEGRIFDAEFAGTAPSRFSTQVERDAATLGIIHTFHTVYVANRSEKIHLDGFYDRENNHVTISGKVIGILLMNGYKLIRHNDSENFGLVFACVDHDKASKVTLASVMRAGKKIQNLEILQKLIDGNNISLKKWNIAHPEPILEDSDSEDETFSLFSYPENRNFTIEDAPYNYRGYYE